MIKHWLASRILDLLYLLGLIVGWLVLVVVVCWLAVLDGYRAGRGN